MFVGSWWNEKEHASVSGEELPIVMEAYKKISEKSVFQPSNNQLVEGAIRGMTESIGDPYSTYYTEEEAEQHRLSLAEERVGVGLEVMKSGNRFVVISPMKNSPAERAGIRPYDEIVQVEKARLDGHSMAALLGMLKGEVGTKVSIVVYRPSTDRHLQLTLERSEILNDTVTSDVIKVEGTKLGLISVSMFGEKTADEWVTETKKLLKEDVAGIVIDVRDNPGCYLHSGAGLASTITKEGTIFAYMQDAEGALVELKTQKGKLEDNYFEKMQEIPLVLLQNEGSASASEVLSGALQAWGRATIIGVTSFGKGTVQDTWALKNGGELKLTTNKWLTPRREWIHSKGIQTDITVEQNEIFSLEMQPMRGEFKLGDMGEEIAYAQKVLEKLGYSLARTDGYFDKSTESVVEKYRKQEKLPSGKQLDTELFSKLHEQILSYKEDTTHDTQLQMGLSVLLHNIEQER